MEEADDLVILVDNDGNRTEESVTELAIRRLLEDEKLRIVIQSVNQLPVSQGFGMSGAGALSSVVALSEALGDSLSMEEQIQIAHAAEVESGTGLGDVYPEALGGMDIRTSPGAPPFGEIDKHSIEGELVLCVLGEEMRTMDVLQDEEKVQRINRFGSECNESIEQNPTLERLFSLGKSFAVDTGLATEKMVEAIEECEAHGSAAMSMLGSSIFAFGDVGSLVRTLETFGPVTKCKVEDLGVRIIH
ncbi:MAG: hypothetical protein JSV43_01470 [Methanobacteriota archaeon]|nr:MAG: hypothetical protein JSV43_01470 [Euryarchaeota archaeon]